MNNSKIEKLLSGWALARNKFYILQFEDMPDNINKAELIDLCKLINEYKEPEELPLNLDSFLRELGDYTANISGNNDLKPIMRSNLHLNIVFNNINQVLLDTMALHAAVESGGKNEYSNALADRVKSSVAMNLLHLILAFQEIGDEHKSAISQILDEFRHVGLRAKLKNRL